MQDPRVTGMSAITDRIVYIRHASAIEKEIVAEELAAGSGAKPDPATTDVVVAFENERRIGFAALERSGVEGTACLTLSESGRRRGIGGAVLMHLLEHAMTKRVLAGGDSARYLENAGFRRVKGRRAGVGACSGPNARTLAAYERVKSARERSEGGGSWGA